MSQTPFIVEIPQLAPHEGARQSQAAPCLLRDMADALSACSRPGRTALLWALAGFCGGAGLTWACLRTLPAPGSGGAPAEPAFAARAAPGPAAAAEGEAPAAAKQARSGLGLVMAPASAAAGGLLGSEPSSDGSVPFGWQRPALSEAGLELGEADDLPGAPDAGAGALDEGQRLGYQGGLEEIKALIDRCADYKRRQSSALAAAAAALRAGSPAAAAAAFALARSYEKKAERCAKEAKRLAWRMEAEQGLGQGEYQYLNILACVDQALESGTRVADCRTPYPDPHYGAASAPRQ
ncbi:MAG: hypothetical protein NTY77_19875 [Elusimicrobia bacterium]|nr:hypothetical protein [Elusimicrobiota bacterium]